ncbi:MAG: hypothetical protein JXB07_17170 [Anaerolineae bacterium]|nr:hypothetical protein [Anaerolineae bacterium]
MHEESHKDQTTRWAIDGVVAIILLLGCRVMGVILAAIGMFIPIRAVCVSQVFSSQVVMATPTSVIPIPAEILSPLLPPTIVASADAPTTEAPDVALMGAQTGIVVTIIDGDPVDVNISDQWSGESSRYYCLASGVTEKSQC